VKVHTTELPKNADEAVKKDIPVLIYPALSTETPGGAPNETNNHPPAGVGTSYVNPEQAESQLKVEGTTNLRRIVMPLPVGFFDSIVAKHIAKQTVDYLPQVPNLPQARTVGRVKPRSSASDWLAIGFDPWSAGKNPLNSEFVPSLASKAEKIFAGNGGNLSKGLDAIDELRATTIKDAFLTVEDAEGQAMNRKEVSKASVLAQDFKKLSSLARHGKVSDAEELVNQPDWNVPIDFQDDQGNTLLHIAAQNGAKRLVKLCLRRGADLNAQNLNGQTALHFAFGYGYNEVGEYLVSKGADDSIVNRDKLTCYEGLGARELSLL
jgi:hypothetical protein